MADKISTLILKVDLDCKQCNKKIRKVLCRLQEKEDIKAILYDEKNKTITISGRFDPEKVTKWLCCKACKVIKEIEIKEDKPKNPKPAEPAKPKDDKPKPKDEKPKDDKPKDEKPKPKQDKPDAKAAEKPEGKKAEPEPKKPAPVAVVPVPQVSAQPGWPPLPVCCCRPLYEGFYGGCRCCTCGRVYGFTAGAPPSYYGGPMPYDGCRGYQFFCEEDPSTCSIM